MSRARRILDRRAVAAVAAVTVSLALGDGRAARAAPVATAAASPAIARTFVETLYAVRLNAVDVDDGALVLADGAGHVYVAEAELHAWRLRVPATLARVAHGDRRYVRLDGIGPLAIVIDDAQQRLVITASPALFEESTLDTGLPTVAVTPTLERGAFLNYDAHALFDTLGATGLSSAFEMGTNVGNGVLVTTELFATKPGRVTRLATNWQGDDLRHDRTWQIGDEYVGEAALGGDVRFAGVRVASDYDARPNFITSPEASVLGTAALPSTVEVYINNVLAATQSVDPGVFRISNLPQVDGEGNVRLVVRDQLGRQTTIDRSYFGSPALLRRGLDTYEAAAGVARDDYGTSERYGRPIISATQRHGFTDRFTGEAHVEATRGLAQGSVVGSWLTALGNVSTGMAIANGPTGPGAEFLASDEISRSRDEYGIQVRAHDAAYGDLTLGSDRNRGGSVAAHAGFRVTSRSSIDLTYAASATGGNPLQRVFTAAYGGSIGAWQVALNAIDPFSRASRYLSVNLLTLVGHNAITATQTYQNGTARPALALQHNATTPHGVDYALTATGGSSPYVEGRATGTGDAYDYQLGFASDGREQQTEFDVRGALARVGGHVYASRTIAGSYGVAILDGLPGVDVSVNNAVVGRTDGAGRILVPNLQPYRGNTISIDPQSLPLETNIGDVKQSAAPYYRSPAIVHFTNLGVGGLIVPIWQADGRPLPAGSTVTIEHDTVTWPVADRGETYVAGLRPSARTTLHAKRPDGSVCTLVIDVPAGLAAVPTVAPVTCR